VLRHLTDPSSRVHRVVYIAGDFFPASVYASAARRLLAPSPLPSQTYVVLLLDTWANPWLVGRSSSISESVRSTSGPYLSLTVVVYYCPPAPLHAPPSRCSGFNISCALLSRLAMFVSVASSLALPYMRFFDRHGCNKNPLAVRHSRPAPSSLHR
jgi:hypothetical protein